MREYGYGMRQSHVRVFHASPDAPPVDVYLNNYPIAVSLAYKSFTPYFSLNPGRYGIRVFPAGTMDEPVIDQMVEVRPQDLITLAIAGRLADIGLLPVGPSAAPRIYGKAFVRLVHLSPNAPPVDVTVQGGPTLFSNVGYEEITNYQILDPGTYTLEVSLSGTGSTVLMLPRVALEANRYYTVYAVGLLDQQPPLEAVLILDMG